MHPCSNLKLLPLVQIHAAIIINEVCAAAAVAAADDVPCLGLRAVADDAVLGDDVVVVAGFSFCAEGGCIVEKH